MARRRHLDAWSAPPSGLLVAREQLEVYVAGELAG